MKNLFQLLLLFTFQATFSFGQSKPNVVLIVADDLGYKDVSYNDGYIKTPSIDYYQNLGVKFNRFYTTAPVCAPTRGAIMTGRISERFGISRANDGKLLSQEINLAEIFATEDYKCGHFGKWHLGTLTTEYFDGNRGTPGDTSIFAPPWEHGFHTSFATESSVPTYDPMSVLDAEVHPYDHDDSNYYGTAYWDSKDFEKGNRVEMELLKGDDNTLIANRALDFIQSSVDNEENFFCNVWFHTPHVPVVPREDYRSLYTDEEWLSIDEDQRKYVNAISSMDYEIGRIFESLEEQGVLENTIVWFLSDNGPVGSRPDAVGELRGRKNTLYEGGVRVPSFIYYEQINNENRIYRDALSTLDILPTVYELVTGDKYVSTAPLDGTSIVPNLMEGEEVCRERPIFCMKDGLKWKSVYDGDYKLICKNENTWELFNLLEDPSEAENLVETDVEKFASMQEMLLAYSGNITDDLNYVKFPCNLISSNDEQSLGSEPMVYPNPTAEKLFVDLSEHETTATIKIFDISAQEVYSTQVDNQALFEVDLSDFKSATYILKVIIDDEVLSISKFIKHMR